MPDNTWVAIAFGYSMNSGLDIAMIKVINGRVFVTDESVHHYGPPMPDYSQNVQAQRASYANGVLRVTFSRPVFASEYFADHSLAGCTPWQFVTVGGMVHGYHRIGKHFQYPIIRNVCTQQCRI
uniref:DOMON domain-containing protein n=1 Tax=Acrobeloides nanus TaxID=290746 RepID=A0A914DQ30_9BILA